MGRNMLPMKAGGGIAGKVIGGLVVLATVALIVQHPGDAAGWIVSGVHLAGRVINGFAEFMRDVL